jgi:hypothetical protein
MSRYLPYCPDQGYLLPPRVDEVLEADHLCFFVHRVVERLDLGGFEAAYSAEGGMLYHPSLLLKVWLYAYALGVTSSRRVEQRIREDLAFRYLAGNAWPDYWALNAFRRRRGHRSGRAGGVEPRAGASAAARASAAALGHRPRCPLFARSRRALRARLYGRDRGLGRPSHRGPAGHRAVW